METPVTTPSPACPHLERSGPVLLRNKSSRNPAATARQVPVWHGPQSLPFKERFPGQKLLAKLISLEPPQTLYFQAEDRETK